MLAISGGVALLVLVLLAIFVSPKAALWALLIFLVLAFFGHATLVNK